MNECQASQEWEAKMANEDRARSPRLWVVVPLNGLVLDKRGMDQIGGDDRASVVRHSALADVSPSDAGSVTRKELASRNEPYDGTKKARAWNQI